MRGSYTAFWAGPQLIGRHYYIRFRWLVNEAEAKAKMKERHVSRLIYGILALVCAFALGWVLGSGGARETVAVTVAAPEETAAAPVPAGETAAAGEAPADGASAASAAETQEPALQEPTQEKPLNLNTATQAQLELLPGIGPALAQAILDYRAEFGPFTAPEQLMEVPGIGEKRFAAVEQLIDVEDTP